MPKSLEDLPDEVILKIFSFFTKSELCKIVSLVCKDWWILSKDPCLWKQVKLDFTDDIETHEIEERVERIATGLKQCTMLEKLFITVEEDNNEEDESGKRKVPSDLFSKIGSIPSLKELLLNGVLLNENILTEIGENYPFIEKLKFDRCFIGFSMIDLTSSCAPLIHLKEFILVRTQSSFDFDDTCLDILSRCCPKLEGLHIEKPNLTQDGVMHLAVNCYNSLREVRLLCEYNETLGFGFGFLGMCQKLTRVEFEGFNVLKLCCLEALSALPLLESLSLVGLWSANLRCSEEEKDEMEKGFEMFFGNPFRAKLKRVDILGLSLGEPALINISQTCSGLEQLEFCNCFGITERGVREIHEKCPAIKSILVLGSKPLAIYSASRNY